MTSSFLRMDTVTNKLVAYERNVARGIDPARRIEYSLSWSLMMVVIAMLVGIYDVASLILIFALNASSILFGWLIELHNVLGRKPHGRGGETPMSGALPGADTRGVMPAAPTSSCLRAGGCRT